MPTLLIQNGFKFFFYANEHLPLHVHVTKGNGYAKIDLTTLRVSDKHLRQPDLKQALAIVEQHKSEFIRRWNDYFAQR